MKNDNIRLSHILTSMKDRCYNPKNKYYKDYGKRGVTICDEWLDNTKISLGGYAHNCRKGYLAFREWALANGYKFGLSIDRIDNDKGYSPENCRWVTMKVQANNNRHNHFVTYNGKTQTLRKWCDELGLDYFRTKSRINDLRWTVERAFESKKVINSKEIFYNGKTQSMKAWCDELGIGYTTMASRLGKLHWSIKKAFETK